MLRESQPKVVIGHVTAPSAAELTSAAYFAIRVAEVDDRLWPKAP